MTESMTHQRIARHAVRMAVAAMCLVGCGGAPSTDQERGTASATAADSPLRADIRRAADVTRTLNSAHLDIRTTGEIDGMIGITTADLDVNVHPLTAVGTSTYQGQIDVPFRMGDDTIAVRLFDEWTSLGSVSDLLAPGLLDPTDGVAKILAGVTDPELQGREVVEGVPTVRIGGSIPAETVKLMDPNANKPSQSTLWISDDGTHRAIRTLVNLGPGQSVETTLSKWNEPVSAR